MGFATLPVSLLCPFASLYFFWRQATVALEAPSNCWEDGTFTYESCCLPSPNPLCWDGVYTPEKCCGEKKSTFTATALTSTTSVVNGNPECWIAGVTYELCCVPTPNRDCFGWDPYFTPEWCCSEPVHLLQMSPLERVHKELLTDVDPYTILDVVKWPAENHYPDSHLTAEIVNAVIVLLGVNVSLWLEVGSFLGGSAITTADTFKALNMSAGIICIDTFSGDVGMWATRKSMRYVANHPLADSALKMDEFGHSRIYETFLANVKSKGHRDMILPLRVSSLVGMRLLHRIYNEHRIPVLPQVIYLDSAHEEDETLLELRQAWKILPVPGVLFGDDWSWEGVRNDVTLFAQEMRFSNFSHNELRLLDTAGEKATQPLPGVALISEHDGTWFMWKRPA